MEPDSSALASGAHARSNTSSLCPPLPQASAPASPLFFGSEAGQAAGELDRTGGSCPIDAPQHAGSPLDPRPAHSRPACASGPTPVPCPAPTAVTAQDQAPPSGLQGLTQSALRPGHADTAQTSCAAAQWCCPGARLRDVVAFQPGSVSAGSAPKAAFFTVAPPSVGRHSSSSPPSPADASTLPASTTHTYRAFNQVLAEPHGDCQGRRL